MVISLYRFAFDDTARLGDVQLAGLLVGDFAVGIEDERHRHVRHAVKGAHDFPFHIQRHRVGHVLIFHEGLNVERRVIRHGHGHQLKAAWAQVVVQLYQVWQLLDARFAVRGPERHQHRSAAQFVSSAIFFPSSSWKFDIGHTARHRCGPERNHQPGKGGEYEHDEGGAADHDGAILYEQFDKIIEKAPALFRWTDGRGISCDEISLLGVAQAWPRRRRAPGRCVR